MGRRGSAERRLSPLPPKFVIAGPAAARKPPLGQTMPDGKQGGGKPAPVAENVSGPVLQRGRPEEKGGYRPGSGKPLTVRGKKGKGHLRGRGWRACGAKTAKKRRADPLGARKGKKGPKGQQSGKKKEKRSFDTRASNLLFNNTCRRVPGKTRRLGSPASFRPGGRKNLGGAFRGGRKRAAKRSAGCRTNPRGGARTWSRRIGQEDAGGEK